MGSFSGTGDKLKKVETLNSHQKKLLEKYMQRINPKAFDLSKNSTFQAGQNFLTDMLNPSSEAYSKFEAPYLRQFQESTVPQIAERFSAYDAQNSSAFGQAMGQAGAGLQEQLASMRTQGMMGASQGAFNYGMAPSNMANSMVGQALGTPAFGYERLQGQPGWGQGLIGGLGQAAGMAGMAALLL